MYRPRFCSGMLVASLILVCGNALAIPGSGDSGVGPLETVAPDPGTASPPAVAAPDEVATIPYSGASDASGVAIVELYVRFNADPWVSTGLTSATTSGNFLYSPPDDGTGFFDLVAEDNLGNRSAAPSGTSGNGDGSTFFDAVLSVDLVAFNAVQAGAIVAVTWETATEIDNTGFMVFSSTAGGTLIDNLSGLLAAEGSPTSGSTYSYFDTRTIGAGESSRSYVLVDVNTSGGQTNHGPVTATVSGGAVTGIGEWNLY